MEQFILDFLDGVSKIDFKSVWEIFFYALGMFWLVVIYWVWLDSGDRTSNIFVRISYVLLVTILNVIGWVIYLIIRPGQTIEEIYWSDLERRYLKFETAELGDCPKCGTQLAPGFTFCPNCRYKLKIKCPSCSVFLDRQSKFCPYCGEETRKKSSFVPQTSPTKEVMVEQILASKEQVTEAVEANKTRYSVQKGVAIKLGDTIIRGYKILFNKMREASTNLKELPKKIELKKEKAVNEMVTSSKKNKKKNKKKGKK